MRSSSRPFRRWDMPAGLAPSVLFGSDPGPGIYVLEFADGSEYVGQSLHPISRLASHRRWWDDIVAVRFTPVAREDLDRAEQEIITGRRNDGVLLRNRTLMSQPLGESALDSIVSQEEQAAWIFADFADADVVVAPARIELAQARVLADPDRLPTPMRTHPHLGEALNSLATYVYNVIPFPHETEGRGWVLSAWPSTSRTRTHRRLCTLSNQNVELLFLFEDRSETGKWAQVMVLNVAPTLPDTHELAQLFDDNAYRTAGPVKSAYLSGWHDIEDVLSNPDVLLAARELALGQLRKGRAMFSRFHSQALADEVFARIIPEGNTLRWATTLSQRVPGKCQGKPMGWRTLD